MINYKIALINVWWSENDINTRFFESTTAQKSYFDTLTAGKYSPAVNFEIGDNINTTAVVRDESGRSIYELCHCNYAVVQEFNDDVLREERYFFAKVTQDSASQVRVVLTLDHLQTNYIRYRHYISSCLIKRANINRFVRKNGRLAFDTSVTSQLFNTEPLQGVSKRLVKRTPLNMQVDTTQGNSPLNNWYKKNILGWEYIYLKPFTKYKFQKILSSENIEQELDVLRVIPSEVKTLTSLQQGNNSYQGACVVLTVPVYKEDNLYGRSGVLKVASRSDNNRKINITHKGLDQFYALNSNTSFVYSRKFSVLPPLWFRNYVENSDYIIDVWGDLTFLSGQGEANINYMTLPGIGLRAYQTGNDGDSDESYYHGLIYISMQTNLNCITENYSTDYDLDFAKSDIIGATKNPKLNPKLLSGQFRELRLCMGNQSYSYDPLKLGINNFQLSYNESLTPDITKGYCRLHNTSGVYIQDCENNFTGLVYNNDNSLMYANDNLSEMLAQNKNYFLQTALNVGAEVVNTIQKPTGLINSVLSTINTGLTLDNMRSSPSQIKNANGNMYFVSQIQPVKLTIEEYDILDSEKVAINDALNEYGYTVNKLDKITNYDNIRKYYNYIEAEIEAITAPLSNEEKEKLKEKLLRVRFWNTDVVDFSLENYEKWIEEDEENE